MSREIKFRAWTGSAMEYRVVVGSLGAFYVEGLDPKDSASMSMMNTLYSKNTPTMQFTGLKDKNGKEIYEGDILSYLDCKGVFVVEWGHWGWRMKGTIPEEDRMISQWGPITLPSGNFEYIEIIGNIYENPDLLTRKDS